MSVKGLGPPAAESWFTTDLELCYINRISHAQVGETGSSTYGGLDRTQQ